MKRIFSLCLAAVLAFGVFVFTACESEPKGPVAYVSIADENGEVVLAAQATALTDTDADGKITIYDILTTVHDENYEGGASAGFRAEETQWGLSMMKLWGVENGGSYGYRVNNASAMGLADEVKEGDHVYAYIYTDTVSFSDTYSFFDAVTVSAKKGDSVTLTLMQAGYDANWNPLNTATEGAVLYINGKASEMKTDANGKVTVTLDKKGEYVITAEKDGVNLVPPVCVITVK